MRARRLIPLLAGVALLVAGCAGGGRYVYREIPGRTGVLRDGYAVLPPGAPAAVQAAAAAGNRIAGLPYRRGGGHGRTIDSAYDCSGAVSHLLMAADVLDAPAPSKAFRRYGQKGKGRWITVYARRGHVFAVVAGVRFDTGYAGGPEGPQWTTRSRPARGYAVRHPPGL